MNYRAQPMAEPYVIDRILGLIPRGLKMAKVLDIATGQGYVVERLACRQYGKLYSADVNATNFRLDKQKFHFKKVDANKPLPYADNSFSLVISSETIEHLENPRAFLREVYRILSPGGCFILTTPSVESIISRLYFLFTGRLAFHTKNDYDLSGHITVLPSWLVERFCEEAGFQMKARVYSSMYIPIVKQRITWPWVLNRFFGWIVIYSFSK